MAGSDTGDYGGIDGSFKMTVTIKEVDSWPRCAKAGQTLLGTRVPLTGAGTLSISQAGVA